MPKAFIRRREEKGFNPRALHLAWYDHEPSSCDSRNPFGLEEFYPPSSIAPTVPAGKSGGREYSSTGPARDIRGGCFTVGRLARALPDTA